MDTLLAILHHLGVFILTLAIAAQLGLVRPDISRRDVHSLALVDAVYGLSAVAVIAVGVARVFLGAKGVDYYADNIWFWAKMATFAAVGLISIRPTLTYRRWAKALRTTDDALPGPLETAKISHIVLLEAGLLLLIPVFAALMARYQG